jgi:hypothetical protein
MEAIARRTYSKPNMTMTPGRESERIESTQYCIMKISKATDRSSELMRRVWKSFGFAGGCCSRNSTLPSPIHCHTFPASRQRNMAKNHMPMSSLKMVMASSVSLTANQALSYNCSVSIGRSVP